MHLYLYHTICRSSNGRSTVELQSNSIVVIAACKITRKGQTAALFTACVIRCRNKSIYAIWLARDGLHSVAVPLNGVFTARQLILVVGVGVAVATG